MGFIDDFNSRGRCLLACAAFGFAATATAQEVIPDFYKEPGLNPNRSYVNQSFNEHVDPFTGALQLHYTDVHVPGNGGFDLSVTRSYNSASIDETNPAGFDSQAGLGWTIHFGRVLNKSSTLPCSQTTFGTDVLNNPVIELPDGSTQLLAYSGSVSPLMYTTQRWKADCASGGIGLIVYSPDGTRYDMTQQVTVGSGTATRSAWYTTKITDRNGNVATITYAAAFSPKITSITTNDSRTLSFSYNSNGFVSSISANGSSYTYSYQAISGVTGAYFLSSVTRPDGASWQYQYNSVLSSAPGSYALKQVTYPQGGTINYGYGSNTSDYVYFDSVSNAYSRSTVVKTKSTSDGGSWTFSYTPGGIGTLDTTTVNGPSGTTTYRHVGPNYATSGSLWMVGLLMKKQIGSTQTEDYGWGAQPISGQQYKRPGAWRATRMDSATNAAILTSRTITLDGQAYSTTYSTFDTYGNPATVTEAGPNGGNRSTSLTYFSGASKWIIKQVQNETVSGGLAITRSFDSNGNALSVTRDGVTTNYLYDSHFDRYRPQIRGRWREQAGPGGGLWLDLGSHLIDQALQLFGRPAAMNVDLMTQRDGAVSNDGFHAQLRYAEGLRVVLHATTLAASPGPRFLIHGTRGSFLKTGLDPQEDALKAGQRPDGVSRWDLPSETATLVVQDEQSPDTTQASPWSVKPGRYTDYYAGVRDAILGRGANPVTGEQAAQVMALLDLGAASHGARKELPIDA